MISKSCLIDNWTLELSSYLISDHYDENSLKDLKELGESFSESFGALSNVLNAIVLYDNIHFLENGFEKTWLRISDFQKVILKFLNPVILNEFNQYLHSISNLDAEYYLLQSRILNSELIISPKRAQRIKESYHQRNGVNNNLIAEVLEKLDNALVEENKKLWLNNIQTGIYDNFKVPSLTHYILSQASSKNDILDVAIQLRESREIAEFKELIYEVSNGIKLAKLQNEISNLIDNNFGRITSKKEKNWSIGISVLFLSLRRSFSLPINTKKEKNYLTFIKDIIDCRFEAYNLKTHTQRLFSEKMRYYLP